MHEVDLALHEKYGPLVRISPNEVSVWSAQAVKLVYGTGNRFVKGDWYEITGSNNSPDVLNMLPETDEEKRRLQRRLSEPIHSASGVQKYEKLLNGTITALKKYPCGYQWPHPGYRRAGSHVCMRRLRDGNFLGFARVY
jgi:hypothetical protein